MNKRKRLLLWNLVSVGSAAGTSSSSTSSSGVDASTGALGSRGTAPLHATLEEPEGTPPRWPSRESGRRRRHRRREVREARRRAEGRATGAAGGPEREADGRRRGRRRALRPDDLVGEGPAEEAFPRSHPPSGTVSYDPETQTPLPPAFLPHWVAGPGGDGATGAGEQVDTPTNNDGDGPSGSLFPEPRIINGFVPPEGRYLYASSLVDTASMAHICGGSLVAPDIILTAGHCSNYFDSVIVGRTDASQSSDTYDHLVVEKHVAHPSYGNVIKQDFALAKLYGTSDVTPVRLNNRRNVPEVDEPLIVAGWGVTEGGSPDAGSTSLVAAEILSLGNDECEAAEGSYDGELVSYQGYIEDNMMCAHADGKDACQGDSGGPLIKEGNDGVFSFVGEGLGNDADDVQVGIVSWGLGCALDAFPGVYSRISAEFEWIRSSICELSSDPPEYLGCDVDKPPAVVDFSDWSRDEGLAEVTVVVELDDRPRDTSWLLEADPGQAAKTTSEGRTVVVGGGKSHVPFDTYDVKHSIVSQTLAVSAGEQYRLTVLDRGANGLKDRPEGQEGRRSRFRICNGTLSGKDCIYAREDSDAVVCAGFGDFGLASSIPCYVDALQTPPPSPSPLTVLDPLVVHTPAPVMFLQIPDDYMKRPTDKPTRSPSATPTRKPATSSPTLDGTAAPTKEVPTLFLSGTSNQFVTPTGSSTDEVEEVNGSDFSSGFWSNFEDDQLEQKTTETTVQWGRNGDVSGAVAAPPGGC
ncbi:hypothetical protein ACHAWF_015233 [Thalassiosira exigua]